MSDLKKWAGNSYMQFLTKHQHRYPKRHYRYNPITKKVEVKPLPKNAGSTPILET